MDILEQIPPGDAVTCGKRKDLVKKQRRHIKLSMGVDAGAHDDQGFTVPMEIVVCVRCGKTEQHRGGVSK